MLFDKNLDQKIDLGWPGLAWVKPWAGPGSSPGLGPGQALGKLAQKIGQPCQPNHAKFWHDAGVKDTRHATLQIKFAIVSFLPFSMAFEFLVVFNSS